MMKNFFYSTVFIFVLISFFQAAAFAAYFDHYIIEYGDNLEKIIYKHFPEARSDDDAYQKREQDIREWNPQIEDWIELDPGEKLFVVKPISPFIGSPLPVKDMVNFRKELKKEKSKYRAHFRLSARAHQQDIQYKSSSQTVDHKIQSFLSPSVALSIYDHIGHHPLELGIGHQIIKWTSVERDGKSQKNAKDESSLNHQSYLYWGIRNIGDFIHFRLLAQYNQFSYLQDTQDDVWKFKILSAGASIPIHFDWKLNQFQIAPFYLKEVSNNNEEAFSNFTSYGVEAKLFLRHFCLELDYRISSLDKEQDEFEDKQMSAGLGVFF